MTAPATPCDRNRLRTVHLVPLTAYDSTGKLDLDLQRAHVARMYAAGVRVFMPAAGTGEFHNLSAVEIAEIVQATREASGPDALIFAPVGFQVAHAIEIGVRSLQAGATGIMFMPLSHPYLCNAGAKDYYLQVIGKTDCPALVYKKSPIPGDALLLELADLPQVVGVKYAENNLHDFRKVVLADNGRLEWLCGSAERFAPYYMLAGATGYTTGAGNLCPHLTLAMHTAFSAGEFAEGMRLQQILLPIEDFRAREGDSFNISMLKYGMHHFGQNFGAPRAPQRSLSAEDLRQIDALLEPILAAEADLRKEAEQFGLVSG